MVCADTSVVDNVANMDTDRVATIHGMCDMCMYTTKRIKSLGVSAPLPI